MGTSCGKNNIKSQTNEEKKNVDSLVKKIKTSAMLKSESDKLFLDLNILYENETQEHDSNNKIFEKMVEICNHDYSGDMNLFLIETNVLIEFLFNFPSTVSFPIIEKLIKEYKFDINISITYLNNLVLQRKYCKLALSKKEASFFNITFLGLMIERGVTNLSVYKFFLDNGYNIHKKYWLKYKTYKGQINILEHLQYYPKMKEIHEFIKTYSSKPIEEVKE